jgi:hypothetical protein
MKQPLTPEQTAERDLLLNDWALLNEQMAADQLTVQKRSARRKEIAGRLVDEFKVTKVELAKSANLSETAVFKVLRATPAK